MELNRAYRCQIAKPRPRIHTRKRKSADPTLTAGQQGIKGIYCMGFYIGIIVPYSLLSNSTQIWRSYILKPQALILIPKLCNNTSASMNLILLNPKALKQNLPKPKQKQTMKPQP